MEIDTIQIQPKIVTPKYTYKLRQDTYREVLNLFFSNLDNYQRLQRIIYKGDETYAIIMYFITEYSKHRLFMSTQGAVCPKTAYTNALKSHQKRFYNFDSRKGRGDLWYNGIINPLVLASVKNGSLSLPLPRLVALRWFIQEDFDEIFWQHEHDIIIQYNEYTKAKKKKYTEAHKQKKKILRQQIEDNVIDEKKEKLKELELKYIEYNQKLSNGKRKRRKSAFKKPRRDTRLTRLERLEVGRRIQIEKKRLRNETKLKRLQSKKRTTVNKIQSSCFINENILNSEKPINFKQEKQQQQQYNPIIINF